MLILRLGALFNGFNTLIIITINWLILVSRFQIHIHQIPDNAILDVGIGDVFVKIAARDAEEAANSPMETSKSSTESTKNSSNDGKGASSSINSDIFVEICDSRPASSHFVLSRKACGGGRSWCSSLHNEKEHCCHSNQC